MTRKIFDEIARNIYNSVVTSLPDNLRKSAESVILIIESRPAPDLDLADDGPVEDLLGLFDGLSLTEQHIDDFPAPPPRIILYRENLLEFCRNREELRQEIRITLTHELGHFFGFGEEHLEEMGLG